MGNFDKIRPISKKIAASLIKGEGAVDMENPEIFDEEAKGQLLTDIKKGARLDLLNQIDAEQDWKALERHLKPARKASKFWVYGAAASMVILIALGIVLSKMDEEQELEFNTPRIINNNIEVGTDKATLTLDDGSEVTLEKGQVYKSKTSSSNGEEIVYQSTTDTPVSHDQIVFNTLTIPRGGQFYMVLSDGTRVWLNSETQLKYPVAFVKGQIREVELIYGEAYFDVSPSTDHNGARFKVANASQNVEVLGTEFNIKAYKGEANVYTTLVEGKVNVQVGDESKVLVPNEQLNLNLDTQNLTVNLVDIYNETSWKEGVFSFEGMSLKDIMKVLSRWYDMNVTIENSIDAEERFIGTFKKNSSIEDILIAIHSTNFINSYEVNDKSLTIK